jgi:hypothetical protein
VPSDIKTKGKHLIYKFDFWSKLLWELSNIQKTFLGSNFFEMLYFFQEQSCQHWVCTPNPKPATTEKPPSPSQTTPWLLVALGVIGLTTAITVGIFFRKRQLQRGKKRSFLYKTVSKTHKIP